MQALWKIMVATFSPKNFYNLQTHLDHKSTCAKQSMQFAGSKAEIFKSEDTLMSHSTTRAL